MDLEIHSAAVATHWGSRLLLWLVSNNSLSSDEESGN
jgi:hypothetical protein